MSLTLAIPGWDLALEGPMPLARPQLPIVAGVYAIVTPSIAPLAKYRLLYADETENLADRVHDRQRDQAEPREGGPARGSRPPSSWGPGTPSRSRGEKFQVVGAMI